MVKTDILNYVATTPDNTNIQILGYMLDDLEGGGGDDPDLEKILEEIATTQVTFHNPSKVSLSISHLAISNDELVNEFLISDDEEIIINYIPGEFFGINGVESGVQLKEGEHTEGIGIIGTYGERTQGLVGAVSGGEQEITILVDDE